MALHLGDTAPDFEAVTTDGRIRFHDWIGDGWAVLFPTRRTSRRSARRNWARWRAFGQNSRSGTSR